MECVVEDEVREVVGNQNTRTFEATVKMLALLIVRWSFEQRRERHNLISGYPGYSEEKRDS